MPFHITEPHPSVPSSHYLHAGRGGAGNYVHVDPRNTTNGSNASGPASRTKLSAPPSNGYFLSGRGGAGNVHAQRERAIFSFDEELEHQRKVMEHQAPVYHIGRGGSGNLVDEMNPRKSGSTRRHGSSSSITSEESAHSKIATAWDKVRSFSVSRT